MSAAIGDGERGRSLYMSMARVERCPEGWGVVSPFEIHEPYTVYAGIDDVPLGIREHLAVLLTAPVGFHDAVVGRRISDDVFWVVHATG